MFNAFRSVIFAMIVFPTAIIFSGLCVFTFPLPYKARYPFLAAWPKLTTWLAKNLCGINYHIKGKENIPEGNAIIVSNHQSTWETLAFFSIFPYTTFVLKKELLQIPIFGWGLRLLNPIAINRKNTRSALDQIVAQGSEKLNNGQLITIFPEGSRMSVKALGKFKVGAATLAVKTNTPIIPVSHDAGKYWSRRAFVKTPGTIEVTVGKPIAPNDLRPAELIEKVKETITKQLSC